MVTIYKVFKSDKSASTYGYSVTLNMIACLEVDSVKIGIISLYSAQHLAYKYIGDMFVTMFVVNHNSLNTFITIGICIFDKCNQFM